MVLDGKSSQEYPVNAGVSQGSILGLILSSFILKWTSWLCYLCNVAIFADDTTPCSKCDQASGLRQQLELASEFESDLRDTMD